MVKEKTKEVNYYKIGFWIILAVLVLALGYAFKEKLLVKTQIADRGDFTLTIEPTEKYSDIAKILLPKKIFDGETEKETVFEHIVEELNTAIALPHDINIVFDECETVNAFYDNETKQIVMCYELLQAFKESFTNLTNSTEELMDATMHSTLFIFFHELAHSMIDILELPATGREEDAGDQLSTVVLVQVGENGEHALLDASKYFLQKQEKELKQSYLWDEHSLNAQRLYNILCWLYGSNPTKYEHLVQQKWLPQRRATFCPEDYKRLHRSWDALLDPYNKAKDEKHRY